MLLFIWINTHFITRHEIIPPSPVHSSRELVVASIQEDDTMWLYDNLPNWTKQIYIVDNSTAELKVPVNKGRESMVYLT